MPLNRRSGGAHMVGFETSLSVISETSVLSVLRTNHRQAAAKPPPSRRSRAVILAALSAGLDSGRRPTDHREEHRGTTTRGKPPRPEWQGVEDETDEELTPEWGARGGQYAHILPHRCIRQAPRLLRIAPQCDIKRQQGTRGVAGVLLPMRSTSNAASGGHKPAAPSGECRVDERPPARRAYGVACETGCGHGVRVAGRR